METQPALPPEETPPTAQETAPTPGPSALSLLEAVRGTQRRLLWWQGLFLGGALLLVGALLGAWEGTPHPALGRALLLATPLLALGVALFFGVWLSRRRVGDLARTARSLAGRLPDLNQDLLAAVELSRALGERHDFSPELARAFLRQLDRRAAAHHPSALVDSTATRGAGALALLTVLVVSLSVAVKKERLSEGLALAFAPAGAAGPAHREPITGDFELSYRYPAHTGLEPKVVAGTAGDVQGPAGTEVDVRTRADRDVAAACLIVNGARVPVAVKGRELSGSFVLDKSGQYHVAFLEGATAVVEGPDLPLQVEADQVPQVRLTAPADRLEVSPEKTSVSLRYEASDDYGLTSLELVYRPQGKEEHRVALRPDEGRTSRGQYAWEVGGLALKPGQSVSYYLEAKDNDAVAGPKKGVSHTQTLTLYSAAEHRRAALAKAEKLWERLVTHLADRLEGPDGKEVDSRASVLASDLTAFAQDLDLERDPPLELVSASRTVGAELQHDSAQVAGQRLLVERFRTARPALAKELSPRLVAAIAGDAQHAEKNVLYLELLLDRARLDALRELAEQLRSERRELSRLMEDFARTRDDKTKDALLEQMQSLRQRMQELQQRMAELAKGIREEHLNKEALAEMMGEEDFASKLNELEKLVREGKSDEAMKKMQELAMEMDKFLEKLDQGAEAADEQADPELSAKFEDFTRDLDETAQKQELVAKDTRALRDRYREQAKERIARQGAALKQELSQKLDELKKDYQSLDSTRLGFRAEDPRTRALQGVDQTKQALETGDFDLASEAADKLAERAGALAQLGDDQRHQDELFQNPASARLESKQLAERLGRDAKRAEEIAKKLKDLFPQGQQLSPPDQRQLGELQKQQKSLQQKAEHLQDEMDDISERAPVFDEDAKQQLKQAGQHMGGAAEHLGGRDPGRGLGEQQGALQALRGLQQQLQQQGGKGGGGKGLPMPMRSRGGHGRGTSSQEKVEIPEEDPNQSPREFRKDVMDAMKQGAPDRYRDQNKHYYEELVK